MQIRKSVKVKFILASIFLWIGITSAFVGSIVKLKITQNIVNIELDIFYEKTHRFLHLDWMQSAALLNMFGNVERSLADETSKIAHTAIIHTQNKVIAGFGHIVSSTKDLFEGSIISTRGDDIAVTIPFFDGMSASFLIAKNYWKGKYPFVSDLNIKDSKVLTTPNYHHVDLYANVYSLICFFSLLIVAVVMFFLFLFRSEQNTSLDLKQKVHDTRSNLINTLLLTRIAERAIQGDIKCKKQFSDITSNQKVQKYVSDLVTFPSKKKTIDVVHVAKTAVSFVTLDLNTDSFDMFIPNGTILCHASESCLLRILINLIRNSLYAIASKPGYQSSFKILVADDVVRFSITNNGSIDDIRQIEKLGYSSRNSTGLGMGIIHSKLKEMDSKLHFKQYSDRNIVEFYFSLKRGIC